MVFQIVPHYLFSHWFSRNQLRLNGNKQGDVRAFTQAPGRIKGSFHDNVSLLTIAQKNGRNVYFKCAVNLRGKYDLVSTAVIL